MKDCACKKDCALPVDGGKTEQKEEKQTLVLASGNAGKIKEFAEMFTDFTVKGYKDFGLDFDIEETGETFYENALIKARTVSLALGLPALADDSGLCVNALGGAPGIYSARYAGDGVDEHNIQKLLRELAGKKDRSASFHCSLVLFYPSGKIVSSEGKTEGRILFEKEGKNGFGYDPIFYSEDLSRSFGTATEEEKNSVSHRARAVAALKKELQKQAEKSL